MCSFNLKEEVMETAIKADSIFHCPVCLSPLEKAGNHFLCKGCNGRFPVKEGIPIFGRNTDFFFWDIPAEKMESALQNIGRVGWQETLLQLQDELPHKAKKLWSRICNPRRWPWIFLLPLNSESRILDLGAGWGNNSMGLARNCKEVYSMDTTYPYLKWIKAYAKNENVQNIIPVQGGDYPHLPFKNGYFDAVTMNGVLEWVGQSFQGDPYHSQMMLLKEVARVLKPAGCLYIGIENRLSYKYFKGRPEGHIKMRFGSLLPRHATRILLKLLRNKDYKVYTYSMAGYRNMLRKAGLEHAVFLAPIPHYSLIAKFMPISDFSRRKLLEPLRFDYSNAKQRLLMNSPLAHFVASFSILSSPSPQKSNMLKDILKFILSKNFGANIGDTNRITLLKIKTRGRLILRLNLNTLGSYFLKIDTSADSKRNMLRSNRMLSGLRESKTISEELKKILPGIIDFGEFGGHVYLLEREVRGSSGEDMVHEPRKRDILIRNTLNFLKMFHKDTGTSRAVDDQLFDEYFRRPISNIKKWMKEDERKRYAAWFEDIERMFYDDLKGQNLIFVMRHGDFVPSNCITEDDGRIKAVLDWEFAQEKDLPLLDLISFLSRAFRPTTMKRKFPNASFPGYPQEFFSPYITDITYEYLAALNIPKTVYKNLVFMWWVKHLEDWFATYRYLSEWKNERIFPIIERWDRILTKDPHI